MVRARPNMTDLEGIVIGHRPHPSSPDMDLLSVQVERTSPIDSEADLLTGNLDPVVEVMAPRSALPGTDLTGQRMRLRVSLVGPGVIRLDSTFPSKTL